MPAPEQPSASFRVNRKDSSTAVQGDHFRASHSPDILRQAAGKAGFRHGPGKKFKVVSYRDWMSDGHPSSRQNATKLRRNPVVIFAKPGKEAGRKVVDYYYTWKGKTGTRPLKGSNRRSHFLQEEFGKDFTKLTDALGQAAKEDSDGDKTAASPSKTSNEANLAKTGESVSSGTAQSLPMGIENSLSKLRIMNPDPSRTSKSGNTNSHKSSQSRKPSPLSKVESPWSSSETLQNPGSDSIHAGAHHTCRSASCDSEDSGSSSTEALIILLDEDDDESVDLARGKSWHGLERRNSSRQLHSGQPYHYQPHHTPYPDEEGSYSDDSYSEEDCCDIGNCASMPCSPPTQYIPTPVQPVYHLPASPVASPHIMPGFVPSPAPHRSISLPPPGFIPLSPRPMQEVIREGRSDIYGQQLLDSYAASSPYAVRPSLYFTPNSPGFVPLPHTPSVPISPLSFHHQYLHMPHRASY